MNDVSERMTEYTDDMSVTLVPTQEFNRQARVSKSIVFDLRWFDRNRTKFEDWWREIQLFLKSNRIMKTDDRITAILAHLREGIVGIYA